MQQPIKKAVVIMGSAVTSDTLVKAIQLAKEQGIETVIVESRDIPKEDWERLQVERSLASGFDCTDSQIKFDLPPEEPPPVDSTNFLRNFGRKKGHWEK